MYKSPKITTATEAVNLIRPHDHIHISSAAQIPHVILNELAKRADAGDISDLHFHHSYTEGRIAIANEKYGGVFYDESFFVGPSLRESVNKGFSDYIPVHLADTQRLYRLGFVPCDVAIVVVSPPDSSGFVSLGGDVVCSLGALDVAKIKIGVVNSFVPFSYGDAKIPINLFTAIVLDDRPLEYSCFQKPNNIEVQIGKKCAELIPDGACIQMGVGALPNAIAAQLHYHKDLGLHSEMFADGVMGLIEKGIINGRRKQIDRGKVVSSFILGSKQVFDFVNKNQEVLMKDVGYTNNPTIIAKNNNVVSVNAAIQIDLTGQVCSDSVGSKIISGTGGQLDFVTGANMSNGGISIITLSTKAKSGVSKIVPALAEYAGVVTPRPDVHWVVTEYGAVNLFGLSLQQRAKKLISIAHPDDREYLERSAFERFGYHSCYY